MTPRSIPDSRVLGWPSLFGLESECQITFFAGNGTTLSRELCAGELVSGAGSRTVFLPGRDEFDLFLSNGGRFYRDSCIGLCNLEYATPECTTPDELIAHIQAGDAIMAEATREFVAAHDDVESALVSRCNFDYHGHTSGSHENHLHTMPPERLAPQLIPLLASRSIVSGGGGFDDASPGLDFMCSPRVRHLEYVISHGAQDSRAIFTVKDESLAGPGFHRLQLLSSESVRCETSERLRFAPVAMLLRIAAAGLKPGEAMRLAHPMAAINAFARDPTGKATAELESGRKVTALEIQRHYLEIAESCLSEPWMPAWAEAECVRWRRVLDALADDAQSLVGHLDWPTKRYLYGAYCERRGIRWESLPRWSRALRELFPRSRASDENEFKSAHKTPRIESMLAKRGGNRSRVAEVLRRHDLDRSDLPGFIELRDKLFETDIRFGEIGPDGLFARLQNEGLIAAGKIGTDEVEYARNNAPPDTRAQVRATWIRKQHTKLAQQKVDSTKTRRVPRLVSSRRRLSRMSGSVTGTSTYECNWDRIRDHEHKTEVRIDDPFQAECGDWEPMKRVRERSIVDREPALGAIAQAIGAGRPRQALARILSLITEQDWVSPLVCHYCLNLIKSFVPNIPVPVLRHGGATAGPVLKALFENDTCQSSNGMFESAGLMLYRFYEAGGQYDHAARVIERLLAGAREKGDEYDVAMLTNNLGYEYLLVGHWPTAEQHFEDALVRFKQIDARTDILNCHANLLECRFSRLPPEKWDALLPMLKTINRALVNSSDWRARKTLRLLARYAQHRGHMRAARGWIRRAIAAANHQPTRLREWDEAYLERLEALR